MKNSVLSVSLWLNCLACWARIWLTKYYSIQLRWRKWCGTIATVVGFGDCCLIIGCEHDSKEDVP